MSSHAEKVVGRARALVGSPFRPQGREACTGLDCVGLALSAYAIPADAFRRNYRLRGSYAAEVEAALATRFRKVGVKQARKGDLLLCSVSSDQLHLAISCGDSFVHADSRLRRIVETPGRPHWPVIAAYRQRAAKAKSV